MKSRELGKITITLGVAAFPEHGDSAEQLFRVADQAVYRAKAEGRDRVIVAACVSVPSETASADSRFS